MTTEPHPADTHEYEPATPGGSERCKHCDHLEGAHRYSRLGLKP